MVKTYEKILNEAASECGAKASSSPRDKFDIGQLSFKAGAEWERKQSEKIVEALEAIYNIDAKFINGSYTSIDLLNEVYNVARSAIKEYRGEQ